MGKTIPASKKTAKRRGRPPTTGKGVLVGGRWHAADIVAIDAWRERQEDEPGRAEAVRRLVRLGLGVKPKRK
jgi:hypothetical protein